MKRTYQRSPILTFSDLTIEQQAIAIEQLGDEHADISSYILWNEEPLPLSNFMHVGKGLFHGAYSLSAFSAYLIRINRTNESAIVAYVHW